MGQIHAREMIALGDLAEVSERVQRVMRSNLRVTAAVLSADRDDIPDEVWRAAQDAHAVTQESAA